MPTWPPGGGGDIRTQEIYPAPDPKFQGISDFLFTGMSRSADRQAALALTQFQFAAEGALMAIPDTLITKSTRMLTTSNVIAESFPDNLPREQYRVAYAALCEGWRTILCIRAGAMLRCRLEEKANKDWQDSNSRNAKPSC